MGSGVQGDDSGGGERAAGLTVPPSRPPWARPCPPAAALSEHPDPLGKPALLSAPSCLAHACQVGSQVCSGNPVRRYGSFFSRLERQEGTQGWKPLCLSLPQTAKALKVLGAVAGAEGKLPRRTSCQAARQRLKPRLSAPPPFSSKRHTEQPPGLPGFVPLLLTLARGWGESARAAHS